MSIPVLVVNEAPVCVSITGQMNRERMWDVHQWNVIQLYKEMKF